MKRFVLASTVMLMALTLGGTRLSAHGPANAQEKGLPGSWLVKVQGDEFNFLSLVTVGNDGNWEWILPTTTESGPSTDSRVVCTGPWHRTGARKYHLTLYCLESQAMNSSSGRYMLDVTLSRDGMRFEDPAFRWEWFVNRLPGDGEPDISGYLSVDGTRLPDLPKP